MGGTSSGFFVVDFTKKIGIFHGKVEPVPAINNAPGFIKVETIKGEPWPDVSSCRGLELTLRSSTISYKGFRLSFGDKAEPGATHIYGFKSDLSIDPFLPEDAEGFRTIQVPFDNFTVKWDPRTGNALEKCSSANQEYCPDESSKKELSTIALWGEGVGGTVDLEIRSLTAYGCGACGSSAAEENGQQSTEKGGWFDFAKREDAPTTENTAPGFNFNGEGAENTSPVVVEEILRERKGGFLTNTLILGVFATTVYVFAKRRGWVGSYKYQELPRAGNVGSVSYV